MTTIQATIRKAAAPRVTRALKWIAAAAIAALAAFLLHRTLSQYNFNEIVRSVGQIPFGRLTAALGFAGASYLLLTGFDWMALRHVRRPLDWPRAALASFTSLSIGHNLGFAALSSGALRYRFYSRWGLGAGEVAQVIVFCGLTVAVGLMSLGGIGLLLRPEVGAKLTGLSPSALGAMGTGLLALTGGYLLLAATLRQPVAIRGHELRVPELRLALAQVAIGTANFACVAACLHQTLAALQDLPYLAVAAAYVTANTAGLVSHVPGGLGVIEGVVSLVLRGDVIGALVAFRVIYYLIPLCMGGAAFVLSELLIRRRNLVKHQCSEAGRATR
ncbi:lysylphosphatidylglycerol synthase domain-containing protein [Desertibaculum subflavum]|uniref:lysylphosphatidylglycerol synthase domain-containing protein n=1 Tax=Desertibaculum subflavum TaxID=2268458 RepID=UPI0034D3536A